MNDQQIVAIVNNLDRLFNQRLTEILKIIEDIRPGSIEDFQKRMFKKFCFEVFMTNKRLRAGNNPNALQIIAHNNKVLEDQKKIAETNEWMDVYQKAAEEAHHFDMESGTNERIIIP